MKVGISGLNKEEARGVVEAALVDLRDEGGGDRIHPEKARKSG